MRSAVIFYLLVLTALAPLARCDVQLVGGGKPACVIVLRSGASPSERRGAVEIQSHVRQMTGAELPIADGSAGFLPERALVIGNSRRLAEIGVKIPADLGDEGFVIKTAGRRVVVAGGPVRGTMYGCTALLEKLGVRWFTPAVTLLPKANDLSLPATDERQSPAFEYREPYFTEAMEKDWAARLRVNGNSAALDESSGGKVRYHPFAHSFDTLIPRSLFDQHPEYFPLIKGKRTNGYVQRCLTNPDVLKLAIAAVRKWIEQDPGATLYSVTQNDTYNFCECEKCSEIAAKYGGQSGLYLWFVNQVADDIAKDHPDKLIDTFAYQFTEPPPKGIAPRDNVRVRLCPIAACMAHPFEKCAASPTVQFMEHLRGWSALTRTLYIWHYNTNFGNYLLPFPDFEEFPADIRLYRRSGVKGVFLEGDYAPGGGGSDAELRSYVMAKLLWDPSADTNSLVAEWTNGVYRAAAKPMRAWFDLLHERVRRPDKHMFIYDHPPTHYLTDDVLGEGDKLFDEAERLATGDGQAAGYVSKSRLWLRYARLASHPAEGADLDRFLADVKAAGIKQLREGGSIDAWEAEYRANARKRKKPPG